MSPPERLLWTRLKGRALGVRFRKQHPLGPYTADFYCHAARLVVEVDGACHDGRGEYDAARSEYLRAHGLEVVRFEGREVMRDVSAVEAAIRWEVDRRLAERRGGRRE